MQTILRNRPTTRLQKYATNVFRVLTVAMVPVACSVPSVKYCDFGILFKYQLCQFYFRLFVYTGLLQVVTV